MPTRHDLEAELQRLKRQYQDTDRSLPEAKILRERYNEIVAQIQTSDALPSGSEFASDIASDKPQRVFICYAREDLTTAQRLYQDLQQAGVVPWMDYYDLLPGQRWRAVINQAIRKSAYVIVLLSPHSLSKRGFVQKELRKALDVVDELPPDEVFVIPIRLEACEPAHELLQELHWVDLFPSYSEGLRQILRVVAPSHNNKEKQHVDSTKAEPPETQITHQDGLDSEESSPGEEEPQNEEKAHRPTRTLCRKPLEVSDNDSRKVFGLDGAGRPLEYIQNQYEDRGGVVFDHATGLLWQKSGSDNLLTYAEAQQYVERLNRQQFGGNTDWRLPTTPELISLVESEKQSNDLYINPIFDSKQWWCWSADKRSSPSGSAWGIYFGNGGVNWRRLSNLGSVRCVRP